MPFPIEEKYITETELELAVKFPADFKTKMMKSNGGELIIGEYEIELFPFYDESDQKRISRTCNHVGLETNNARSWSGFPKNAIAIGSDGFGNLIILIHNGNGILKDELYFWNHENGQVEKIGESINEFDD